MKVFDGFVATRFGDVTIRNMWLIRMLFQTHDPDGLLEGS